MNTLLVIDMQNAWLNGDTARFDKEGVIARINQAARAIRKQGGNVVFIRHCNDEASPGSTGWEIDSKLEVTDQDVVIDKTACDSFANTDLLEKLQSIASDTLLMCGLATEFCVDTTIRAALSHGFDVIALSDAHTTGNRPHLGADKIIEHHNWVWANIAAPQGRTISVKTVQQAFG